MSAAHELTGMIDKLVTEKTFTMDALEAIQALKVKAEQLEAQNEKLTKDLTTAQANVKELTDKLSDAHSKNQEWNGREKAIVARELKMFENEKNAAVANAVSAAYRDALKTVFAPNVVRQSVMAYGQQTSNGMTYPTSDNRTTATADGYGEVEGQPVQTKL